MTIPELRKVAIIGVVMVASCWVAWNYYDARYFIAWAEVVGRYGLLSLYHYSEKVAYMPLAPIFFIVIYTVSKEVLTVASILGLTTLLTPVDVLRLLLKIPIIISILGVGYYMYKREGWNIARYWLYGIPVWMVMWQYQFDPIMMALTVIGAYTLLDRKVFKAGLLWGIGAAFKYVPLLMVPIALKAIKSLRGRIIFLSSFTLPIIASLLPFLQVNAIDVIKKTLGFHLSRYPQMLSIFEIPYLLTHYNLNVGGWVNYLWLPLFATSYILVIVKAKVDLEDKDTLFSYLAAVTLLFIVFNKVSNPQYLLWPYPFLVYLMGRGRILNPNFKTAVITSTIVALILYPFVMFFPAAAIDRTVYVEEDASWLPARLVLLYSFDGRAKLLISKILYFTEYFAWDVMSFIYNYSWAFSILLIIVYNTLLIYILFQLLNVDLKNHVSKLKSIVGRIIAVRGKTSCVGS